MSATNATKIDTAACKHFCCVVYAIGLPQHLPLYAIGIIKLLQTTLIDTIRSCHTNNVYMLCNLLLNRF